MWEIKQQSGRDMGGNTQCEGFAWRATRTPEAHIYLFNISDRVFSNVGRMKLTIPGVNTKDRNGNIQKETLPGMEDKPYRYVTSFPHPVLFTQENLNTNQWDFIEQDGRLFVMDLINPDLAAQGIINQDREVSSNDTYAIGLNIARSGVFFDFTRIPSQEILLKAYARLEKYYADVLEKARVLGLTEPAKLQEELRLNPDFRHAAEFVGEEFDWHKKQLRAVDCLHCGEKKTTTKPFHKSKEGFLCVDPTPAAWRAAYNVGWVSKDRVPEDFRWWQEIAEPVQVAPVTPKAVVKKVPPVKDDEELE